ncbi:MAG: hypothetical protein E7354_00820 [Clostridiales bacterium]|nr:hypothetical protein [Clostridiales bacterium]
MDLLFILFYVGFLLIIELQYFLKLLYNVQLSGYTLGGVFRDFVRSLSGAYVHWILYLVVFISLLVINYTNIYFLTFMLILSGFLLVLSGDKFRAMKSIKYTKRMWRILVLSVVILFLYTILTILWMNKITILVMMPFILLINYCVLILVLMCLMPIECVIKLSYIRKAKIRLLSMKNLIRVGITGSYGKTSTKEILHTILSEHYYTVSTPKSFNTPMGITKVVLNNLKNTHEVFVCEMGAKKVGEIKELCDLVDVGYGIVTSVGRQHTSTFGSTANIYRTKKELPDYLTNKSCVFNLTNRYVREMYHEFTGVKIGVFYTKNHILHNIKLLVKKYTKIYKKYTISVKKYVLFDAPYVGNVYAKNIEMNENGLLFDVYYNKNKLFSVDIALVGVHNVINTLLSIAMAIMLGVNTDNIERGIRKIKPIKARLEKFEGESGAIILNNGYNSNIDSVDYSLGALKLFRRPNILVITPGLIEAKNLYNINKSLGQKIAGVSTEVIIVKKINRDAIYAGLMSRGFDMSKVYFVSSFSDCRKLLATLGNDYVVLIENDLPDNYI